MSLFSLVKATLESNGWKVPTTSVTSSTDDNIKQAFVLANKELVSLSFGFAWPVLTTDYTFETVAGQAEYDLPIDFHHIINPSVFNASQYYAVKGNIQPMEFIRYSTRLVGPWNPCTAYRIKQKGKKFVITPTPNAAETVLFFYVSKNLVKDVTGNEKQLYSQDDDVALIDEDLLELGLEWRWRAKKGLDYTAEIAEYTAAIKQRYAQYIALPEFPIGARPLSEYYPLTEGYVQGPFGA